MFPWAGRVEPSEPLWSPDAVTAWRFDPWPVVRWRRHGYWLDAECEATARTSGQIDRLRLPDHDAPFAGCICGFYAVKGRRWWWRVAPWGQPWRVQLAGHLIEHSRGWRAARIRYVTPVNRF